MSNSNITLQLGDIIEINAPSDSELDQKTFFISYIDENKIQVESGDGIEQILTLTDGKLDNESIESLSIKSRAEEAGYARQNNLLPNVWIDIYFEGDLPMTVTGKITNLDEDKIEVTTFPTNDVIFIDFAYKGVPEDLPIDKIQIRRSPDVNLLPGETAAVAATAPEGESALAVPAGEETDVNVQAQAEQQEQAQSQPQAEQQSQELPEIPEDENISEVNQSQIDEQNKTYIFNADQIKFGNDLEEITHFVDVPEEERRFDIDKQLDDLLDDMLSTIPNAQRTTFVKQNIHKMIQRFKELRETYSVFDDKGYAVMPKEHGANYKPVVPVLERLEQQLYWIMPVVKYIKKIYDRKEDDILGNKRGKEVDDIELMSSQEINNEILRVIERYESGDTLGDKNKYVFLQKELNAYSTPFKSPQETEDVIAKLDVNTTIMSVVDTQGDFVSSVESITNDSYLTKRFAVQTYNTGTTGMEVIKVRGENPIIKRNQITASDNLYLKSFLTLPEQTVLFSKVNLPASNMLLKANLNMKYLNYWQLLNHKTTVTNTTIKDFGLQIEYGKHRILKGVHNFKLDAALLKTEAATTELAISPESESELAGGGGGGMGNATLYSNYLNTMIPTTHALFNYMKPHLTGKLSLDNLLSYLEPFMIYTSNLNYAQYEEMNNFINEKIREYKKNYINKSRDYGSMRHTVDVSIPSFIKIFDDSPALKERVLTAYGFTDTIMRMSNSEFIKRITEIDGGAFYNNALSITSVGLMIADGSRDMINIDNYLKNDIPEELTKSEEKRQRLIRSGRQFRKMTGLPSGTPEPYDGGAANEASSSASSSYQAEQCKTLKTIAKRYIELDELYEDNGKDIYFDKRYDITPYEVGDKFKTDDSMALNDRIKFYVEKLIKSNGIFGEDAKRSAKAIILRKRLVEDGDYAILETTDENSATMQYYFREGNQWVLDESIYDKEMIADNTKMFCNLNEKCIEVKGDCKEETSGASEIKKYNLKMILQEFNTTLNVTKDIVTNQIETELNNSNSRIEGLINLQKLKKYKNDLIKTALGNTVEAKEIIVSPYAKLRDTILSQTDLAKRYQDVSKFVTTFTRDPNVEQGDSSYWYYCMKTNTKLLPIFIYTLAKTFLNGRNFSNALDRICKEQGTLSEDGDKWVDKYSGYAIKMIELNEDESYNEQGFKVITHEVVDPDIEETLTAAAANTLAEGKPDVIKRKFVTADAKSIYTVIDTMSSNMGIQIDEQHDFIVRNVLQHLSDPSVMPPKAKYEKQIMLSAAKNIILDTYENTYNAMLIYFTLSYLLIAIQTSIPPVKTKTTFPGCKKSFSGFPVEEGADNTKGLNYISCVVYKIKGSKSLPWSAIAKFNAKYITKQMEVNITKYILPRDEVQNKIKELKVYLTANPNLTRIPNEHSVTKWVHFYPPLGDLKMQPVQDVGEVFKANLSASIQKGNASQHELITELQSKIFLYSLNIIELIQQAVKGEAMLLKNSTGEPFIENACCNESDKKTLQYFIKKVPDIAVYNNKVVRLSDFYTDIKTIGKPSILYDPRVMKRSIPILDNTYSEETIYRAFIVYCRFNSFVPMNEDLKAICPTKPDNFNSADTLHESIRKLKNGARNYTINSLQQLLGVVNNATKQPIIPLDTNITTANKLTEIITQMNEANVKPSIFRSSFLEVLKDFEIGALMEDTEQLRAFKNTLAALNDDVEQRVMEFVLNNSTKIQPAKMKQFKECFGKVTEFIETGDGVFIGKNAETNYKMINFMKKTMRYITNVLPNIIINQVNYGSVTIPEHWKLSKRHEHDVRNIIRKHYLALNAFYGDNQIGLLLEKFMPLVDSMEQLAHNTLFYTPVELQTGKGKHSSTSRSSSTSTSTSSETSSVKYSAFDLDLTALLFRFYFSSVFTDLISLQNDEDILQMPLNAGQNADADADAEDEDELFSDKTINSDILEGNKSVLAEKITNIIITLTTMVCNDKNILNHNYKSLMEIITRSREKEKDAITGFFKNLKQDEKEVEKEFKRNKLERWSKGNRIHTYDAKTYDEEREEMEQTAIKELRASGNPARTHRGNAAAAGAAGAAAGEEEGGMGGDEQETTAEENAITYLGEDAEYEDYEMDGDEGF